MRQCITEDKFCLFHELIESSSEQKQYSKRNSSANDQQQQSAKHSIVSRYQQIINNMTRRFRQNNSSALLIVILATIFIGQTVVATTTTGHSQLAAQARSGGLEPNDYIDEAGELDIMANQPQIPTAQLMSAAGHIVPENFFLPGGSIPAIYSRYNAAAAALVAHQQQQAAQSQPQQSPTSSVTGNNQQDREALQQLASHLHARYALAPNRYYGRAPQALDLLVAAAAEQQQQQHENPASLIDFNSYNLAASPDGRDSPGQMDLADFLGAPMSQQQQTAALYEQQLAAVVAAHQHQQQQYSDQQVVNELAALASNQQQQQLDTGAPTEQQQRAAAEHYMASPIGSSAGSVGPDYQVDGAGLQEYGYEGSGKSNEQQKQQQQQQQTSQQRPYGLPTKSSSKEPSGMLKPLGNPKTVSSPVIDFVANNLPKTNFDKLAEKIPASQTPTILSVSSSKDPMEKIKSVNQKKRNVIRQAEQVAKLLVKSFNDKFGTNIGDQTDIPFLLSTLGPLGFAQNILLDPTLLVTLLNSAEKTYFSDVLPGPAKSAIRPVLNFFRVPNKKRDKANLLNIIGYLTSGAPTTPSTPSKHRQSFGIEKSNNKNKNDKR